VRDFYVNNALYWLEEYRFDGLRLDAVHAILDDSQPPFLTELAKTVRAGIGSQRHVHLVLENDDNAARFLGDVPGAATGYDAQWNDDVHHALHTLITGEKDGYYLDYAEHPCRHLGRALAEGFAFQGEPSPHRDGRKRGEPSTHLRPTAFVSFLQNHDQVGNRAYGERIGQVAQLGPLRSTMTILLLAPQVPLLFMGEEWGATTPFPFFCDFQGELAARVREGRRGEFARFERFRDEAARLLIPDPGADVTFESARLDWDERNAVQHATWLELYRTLLHIRAREVAPRLAGAGAGARYREAAPGLLQVDWILGDRSRLHLLANMSPDTRERKARPPGRVLYTTDPDIDPALSGGALPAWTVAWTLEPASG
jgi:malto-oligosyltrehalose trehalohydrolase